MYVVGVLSKKPNPEKDTCYTEHYYFANVIDSIDFLVKTMSETVENPCNPPKQPSDGPKCQEEPFADYFISEYF